MDLLHNKWKDNVVADALSRKDEKPSLLRVSVMFPNGLMRFKVSMPKIQK